MKIKHSSILIFFAFASLGISFLLGFLCAMRLGYLDQNPDEILYLDIKASKKSIEFSSVPEKIKIRVNGEIFASGSLNLEN